MEKVGTWDKETVITELTQGRELANQLRKELHPTVNSREACGFLLERILSSYDNALALLNCVALLENGDPLPVSSIFNVLESPNSLQDSPRSEGSNPDSKDQPNKNVSKKRKTLPRWSEQVRVCSGTGFEGQLDDGHNWRKYGQKDILGASHPRSYYRCTHRNTQGCLATKQVQRMDEDPLIFEVIYRGKHTCFQERLKQNNEINLDQQKKEAAKKERKTHSQQMIIANKPDLKVDTQEMYDKEENFPTFSFPSTPIEYENMGTQFFSEPKNFVGTSYSSPPFLSPSTSESYFSLSTCPMNDFGILQSSESDFTEIVSNPTLVADFPSDDLDLLIDQVNFDSHFLDASDYF